MAHPQHNFTSNFNGSEGHNAELTLNINGAEHKYTPAGNDKEFTVTGAVRIDINLDGSELAARIMTVLDGDSLPLLVQQNLDGTEDSYTYVGLQDNKWLFGRVTTTHIDSVAVSTFDGAVRRETLALASDVAIVAYNDPAVYTKLRTAVALGHLPVLDYQGTYATYVTIDNNILKFATEAADPNVESYVYTVTSDNTVTATPRNAGVVRADSVDVEPGTLIDKLEVVDNVRDPEDVPLLQLETTVDGQGNRKVAINEDGLHEALDGLGGAIGNLQTTVSSQGTAIGNLQNGKKDKQQPKSFNGSATKTVKTVAQNENGEVMVEYEDIDFPPEVPNVNIVSPNNTITVSSSTNPQTSIKTFEIDVSRQNKIITAYRQDFTSAEQAQARANIGACAIASNFVLSGSHTITSTESSNGSFVIEHTLTNSQKGKIWLESICLTTNSSLSDDVVPMTVQHKYTYDGGGRNIDSPKTGIFAKVKNSTYFGVDANNMMNYVTDISYVFNFGVSKISEGVVINYEIDVSVMD